MNEAIEDVREFVPVHRIFVTRLKRQLTVLGKQDSGNGLAFMSTEKYSLVDAAN